MAPKKRSRKAAAAAAAGEPVVGEPVTLGEPVACDDHPSLLLSHLEEQRRTASWLCDVEVGVGEGSERKTFKVHRCVLAAGSDYFAGLFRSDTAGASASTVELPECPPAAAAAVVEFIYTGQAKVDESLLGALLAAAARLQVQALQRETADAIVARLAPENALAWWDAASRLTLPALVDASKHAALRDFEQATSDDDALATLTQPQLLELITDDRLVASSEESVHTAVVRWARRNPDAGEDVLLELFGGVRFALLGREFVEESVNTEPLLLTVAGQRLVAGAFQRLAYGEVTPRRLGFGPKCLYLLGAGGDQKGVEIFDGKAWRAGPKMGAAGPANARAISLDGKIYITAKGDAPMFIYNPQSGEWQCAPPPDLPPSRFAPVLEVLSGKIHAIGQGKSVRVFDPQTGAWHDGPNLLSGVENPAVAVLGEKMYLMGGHDGIFLQQDAVKMVQVFDPKAGSWQAGPDLGTARTHVRAAVLDGKIYVVGGMGNMVGGLSSVEVFDPKVGSWQPGPPLPSPMIRHVVNVAMFEGKLHAVSRTTRESDTKGYVLDPQVGSWQIMDLPSSVLGRSVILAAV